MPRKGNGSITKVIKEVNGKKYTYWTGRITVGYDPGTGKRIVRSVSAQTQKEVLQKLADITHDINHGTYIAPSKTTVKEWMDIWSATYLAGVKDRSKKIYCSDIRLHITPYIGSIKLEALTTPMIQEMYNALTEKDNLSPKSVKNVHGVLHEALDKAVSVGYIRFNPSEACVLPRRIKPEITPLDQLEIADFLKAIKNTRFENLFIVALFTGMRQGELLGLTWDRVNFQNGTILIDRQMQLHQENGMESYILVETKNGKGRTITLAPTVVYALKRQRAEQAKQALQIGSEWHNDKNLVFTNIYGGHLVKPTVYRAFKRYAAEIGRPDARFHDMRHSYAVASLQAGDDIKTVQENLGHATASFTLDVYGHVSNQMKIDSANRMERFIQAVNGDLL